MLQNISNIWRFLTRAALLVAFAFTFVAIVFRVDPLLVVNKWVAMSGAQAAQLRDFHLQLGSLDSVRLLVVILVLVAFSFLHPRPRPPGNH